MAVTFTNSGTLNFSYKNLGTSSYSGVVNIFNEELDQIVYSGLYHPNSLTKAYTINNMHSSKDNYYISYVTKGYVGNTINCSGLSPTVPSDIEGFQESYIPISGTQILYYDFEDASTSGLTLTATGTGITSSGLMNNTTMDGNYYLGMQSSGDSYLQIVPNIPEASGLLKGRTIFLVKNGTSTTAVQQTVGFGFLFDGSGLGDNCYKVFMTTYSDSSKYKIDLRYGAFANASTGMIETVGSSIESYEIDYYNTTVRTLYRRHWIIVEWEVDTDTENNVKIGIYHKPYVSGDTIESVRRESYLISQRIWVGTGSGPVGLYTTTSQPVRWMINSDSSVNTGIDCIYLESINHVTDAGLFNNDYKLVKVTTGADSKPSAKNILYSSGIDTKLQGLHLYESHNPLVRKEDSIFDIIGLGYGGIELEMRSGSALTDHPFISFIINPSEASGIKYGVFRTALYINTSTTVNGTKFGFSFLRQGSAFSSNCYTMELYRSGTNAWNIRIRKGVIMSSYGDTSSFDGTILATSSSIPYISDSQHLLWLEIRWKAGTLSTDIEVLTSKLHSGYFEYDYSPGNVDYALTSLLSVTDSSSPYTSTSNNPIVTLSKDNSGYIIVYRMELRKSKYGN